MRARDQARVADVLQCAFVRAVNADLGQLLGHRTCARPAPVARVGQAFGHARVGVVKAQADDVHGDIGKGHGNLDARQVLHALRAGRFERLLLAADLVVIGQRPQIDPVGRRTRRQLLGRERAIGRGGVAVQVGVEGEGHRAILRSA